MSVLMQFTMLKVLYISFEPEQVRCSVWRPCFWFGQGADLSPANAAQGSKTFVENVFEGQLSSCVRCCTCGRESVTVEPFMDLSLPIPSFKPSESPECAPGHVTCRNRQTADELGAHLHC
jgi:hypothetical protein